jgi:hypothetical protein
VYKKVRKIKSPDNKLIKIWRYMDFIKFVSILDRRSLYFTEFRRFEDPIEGNFPNSNRKETIEKLEKDFEGNQAMLDYIHKENPIDYAQKGLHGLGNFYINCWHENEYESAAMWKFYSDQERGIAIQSTFNSFKNCFYKYERDVIIGEVEYLDYDEDSIPLGNEIIIYEPFIYKRKSFVYENEIRAIVYISKKEKSENTEGIYVPVSLNRLIEKIYVSPKSPEWFLDLVKSITKKYRLKKEVIQSNLYKGLLY